MASIIDFFRSDEFSAIELMTGINREPFLPTLAGEVVFQAVSVPTTDVAMQVEKGKFCILDVRPRGAPPPENNLVQPEYLTARTRMINDSFTIQSEQIQNITNAPYSTQRETLAGLVARYQAQVRRNLVATFRQSYLSVLTTGKWVNNGNTIIDWFSFWGQSQASEIDFALTTATTDVLGKCEQVRSQMVLASDGLVPEDAQIHALMGANFSSALRSHAMVRDTYMGFEDARTYREQQTFNSFNYGGITWHNFRGTADGTTIALAADKVFFYPVGTDVFKTFYAPHDSFSTVNTPGIPLNVVQLMDPPPPNGRNQWVKYEYYTYPLISCLQPAVLQRGKKA